ncbi:MAG: hypothetical protein LBO74_02570 [Candidatus Symbiothrix sp.]|jgi:hypothetical protein|nr:hypothetical protein [Candidatus Symbiothrix sp.]
MKRSYQYSVRFIGIVLLFGLLSCKSEKEKMISLICEDNFTYWLKLNWDEEYHVHDSFYIRFGNDGSYGYYDFVRGSQFLQSEETDVLYPNHWEIKDDSTIVLKRNHPVVPQWSSDGYEKKIIYLTKDTMILSYDNSYFPEKVYKDTLVTPPDSIRKIIESYK